MVHHKGLSIEQHGISGSGIAHMADGRSPFDPFQIMHIENFRHQAHAFVGKNFIVDAPVHGYARTFLAPVLKGIQSEIGDFGSFRVLVQPEHPAFIFRAFTWGKRQMVRHFAYDTPG